MKRTLVHQKLRADRVGGDPVYVRGRGETDLPAASRADDEAALHRSFVHHGREPLLGSVMTSSFTAEEQSFADEVRAWLAAHLERPAPVPHARRRGRLGPRLAGRRWPRDRWVGIHWPADVRRPGRVARRRSRFSTWSTHGPGRRSR